MNKNHTDYGFHNTKKHPILPPPPPFPKEFFVRVQDVTDVQREI